MRGGVTEKSSLVVISSPFDVRLNEKYISPLLAAVSRGQERSLKNFGSNSLRACSGEMNRELQSAASGAGGRGDGDTGRGTVRPPPRLSPTAPGAPVPPEPGAHHLPPGAALQPLASARLGVDGVFFLRCVWVYHPPPTFPSRFLGADAAPWHASPFHQHPDPNFLSPR